MRLGAAISVRPMDARSFGLSALVAGAGGGYGMKRFLAVLLIVCGMMAAPAQAGTIKAAVFRSTGTIFLGQTIWPELNSNWSAYGNVPVQIDYDSLAGNNITLSQLQTTQADVIILSNPAFWTYTVGEMAALKEFVEAGHGLIISYGKFRSADYVLAPLVGLAETNQFHTVTLNDPMIVDLLEPSHFLFSGIEDTYVSGTSVRARPPIDQEWILAGGNVIADVRSVVAHATAGIITHETPDYRGVYFAYYPEDASGGSNVQDKQVFYNSLLWAAGMPEPASGLLFFLGTTIVLLRRPR